jgi:xanthine dehydrogenase accessory factor
MDSADREALTRAAHWLDEGHAVYLVTVLKTWGSSPRPPGSLLAVSGDGRLAGSVSGGCIEDDLLERLARPADQKPWIETYGVSPEQVHKFGLPCGGRLDLLIEPLVSTEPLQAILRALDQRALITRRVCLATGEASLHPAGAAAEFSFDGANVAKVFGPGWRLLLIGAGQLSRYVAEMAAALDYEVIVCDPRAEYARSWLVTSARLDARMPDDAVRALAQDGRTAVVALTHDPKLDDLALLEALAAPAFYVGALGSRANNSKRRARLRELGIAPAALARLHGPVGLPIGSRTPAEIAISILAEITAVRRGVQVVRAADVAMEKHLCAASSASC